MALNKDDEWVDVSLLLIPATGNEIKSTTCKRQRFVF